MLTNRIKKLQKTLQYPLLVSNSHDLAYLTGHNRLSGSFLLLTKNDVVLFGAVLEKVSGIKTDSLVNLGKYLQKHKILQVENTISIRYLDFVKQHVSKVKIETIPCPVSELRLYKDQNELKDMTMAYEITAKVFNDVKKYLKIHKNVTEIQLAKFIHISGLNYGAEDLSFPVIVASGKNAAIPHHVPTNKKLTTGESVILDFGFMVNGYCSDFTRTIFIKSVPKKLEEVYLAAELAYKKAIKELKNGVKGVDIDTVARGVLRNHNYEQYFIHSLGHGTGLEIHEQPNLSPRSKDILKNNMVFSIEPGVYIGNLGGVRIEDLVYLKNGKAAYLKKVSTALKDMII